MTAADPQPTDPEFLARAAAARQVGDIGDGWMTGGAKDMVRIAGFAGFDTRELVRRGAFSTARSKARMVNAASVERVMGEMEAEANPGRAAEPQQAAAAFLTSVNKDGDEAQGDTLGCGTSEVSVR